MAEVGARQRGVVRWCSDLGAGEIQPDPGSTPSALVPFALELEDPTRPDDVAVFAAGDVVTYRVQVDEVLGRPMAVDVQLAAAERRARRSWWRR